VPTPKIVPKAACDPGTKIVPKADYDMILKKIDQCQRRKAEKDADLLQTNYRISKCFPRRKQKPYTYFLSNRAANKF
jgi:hypothetical protein